LILTPAITLPNAGFPPGEETTTADGQAITVYLSEKDATLSMPMTEYLVGAVSAEMPVSYRPQALMAQAVACHTYALYRRAQESASPTASLRGADLSDQPEVHQGYLSKEQRKEKWGDEFEENEAKVRQAVEEVKSKIMTYDGKPICAAFFAISSGQTESAQTVFGDAVPYLQSVPSDADLLSPSCAQTVVLSESEFSQAVQTLGDVSLSDDADTWIGAQKTTDSGFVEEITVGGKTVSGNAFRQALSLRSAVFIVTRSESGFRIQTKGYGHLVGLSQYGANAMAQDGADYKQILSHYYTGVTINDE
jgi:stage II sporulation protein D